MQIREAELPVIVDHRQSATVCHQPAVPIRLERQAGIYLVGVTVCLEHSQDYWRLLKDDHAQLLCVQK